MSELGPSPLAAGDKNLSVAQAREAIAAALRPITQAEDLPVDQALGRVLAVDVISPIDVPAHDNSAMDGYAFDGRALRQDGPTLLRSVGTLMAGAPYGGTVGTGDCLRIMTGAVMPTGLDTVVPLELCRSEGSLVHVEAGVIRAGENRRRRGEDLAAGRPAVQAGRFLKPADMGLIASLGVERVPVFRRLRVALFSTGDEIRTLGQPLDPGCVYDSNRYSLMGALQRLGMEVVDLGLVRDDPQALHSVLEQATARADAVVTSGGVSMGDADHTRDVLAQRGQVAFWKVAMRPGRPFAFGPLRRSASADGSTADVAGAQAPVWLFALPGNPVAALVTFYVFAREALLSLAGATATPLPVLQARCLTPIRKRPGRTEFQRAIVEPGPAGWQVRLTGSQGAGVLRSMSEANALVVLGHEQASVAAGDLVDVWLFDGLT
ncbi:MAG: molybdopterin molybdotransferase MoeA [Rubrivivax sp.]|jgi:molybdopterin molybdotransferase|nr:molybdopterin molybdotransferase MoeA [Betaproteobacteria bacterium]MBP6319695.1 molybdopterin molybdotransferase MoeA [Rubrivivax sp.]MBK6787955.1 molybdopterin molybdotransferase MoeA [Betaproteobacteria bacterium]MBK7275393.1 molybdopterin molybdotransferase MoeA [Betaproteobacteria bacterium]MBK7514576.1 molybdopterin molybdotransferase MoeA [Betaproteobacteria bacterium]